MYKFKMEIKLQIRHLEEILTVFCGNKKRFLFGIKSLSHTLMTT